MNKEDITCPHCEAEFYVECEENITFCVVCGEEIGYDEEEYLDDYWYDEE